MKEQKMLLVTEDTEVKMVSRETIHVLEEVDAIMDRLESVDSSFSKKIRLIKLMRLLGYAQNNGEAWGLRACKIFIENHLHL